MQLNSLNTKNELTILKLKYFLFLYIIIHNLIHDIGTYL